MSFSVYMNIFQSIYFVFTDFYDFSTTSVLLCLDQIKGLYAVIRIEETKSACAIARKLLLG